MHAPTNVISLADWVDAHGFQLTPIIKQASETAAWFASAPGQELFLKLYPPALTGTRAAEIAIAGANLHPAIIPLRQVIPCREGTLLVYPREMGENLGPMAALGRFQRLPLAERVTAVLAVAEALAAVVDAGFMVVDWYEGNMLYDFVRQQIRLFDWDLCRRGEGFTLEMDANYGSSRLMAPEESLRGSWLDQRTLVFKLGRYALMTLPELAEPLAPILARATYPSPSGRYGSLCEFMHTFVKAVTTVSGLNR